MRIKKPLRDGLDYAVLFREPINKLHRKFDVGYGAEKVSACCDYALRVLRDPWRYVSPSAPADFRFEFSDWYWAHPDLFVETMLTIRRAWFNATDTMKAQIFITSGSLIQTCTASFVRIEDATDGEISSATDDYWNKKISLATVKKARQLLSAKGKARRG